MNETAWGYELYPLGETAVTIRWRGGICERSALLVDETIRRLAAQKNAAIREWVRAYASVTLYYDPWMVVAGELNAYSEQAAEEQLSPYERVCAWLRVILDGAEQEVDGAADVTDTVNRADMEDTAAHPSDQAAAEEQALAADEIEMPEASEETVPSEAGEGTEVPAAQDIDAARKRGKNEPERQESAAEEDEEAASGGKVMDVIPAEGMRNDGVPPQGYSALEEGIAGGQAAAQPGLARLMDGGRSTGQAGPSDSGDLEEYGERTDAGMEAEANETALIRSTAIAVVGEGPSLVTIPVCFGGLFGPDLAHIAQLAGLDHEEQAIELFCSTEYVVHMIGFLPGFPYLGGLPDKLAAPRREEPRASVPAGSVAIAGQQAGIYPLESPGGWNLIGQTPLWLFQADRHPPALLKAGDRVRFEPISPERFAELKRGSV